jgi:beta-phosphoglucomutase-like phosphatase (HAD superfamily)
VARGKPAPDLFLAAASALGVAPCECVVIEDAPAGVSAANAAGMTSLGLARTEDAAGLSHADLVVGSLDDVDLGRLLFPRE